MCMIFESKTKKYNQLKMSETQTQKSYETSEDQSESKNFEPKSQKPSKTSKGSKKSKSKQKENKKSIPKKKTEKPKKQAKQKKQPKKKAKSKKTTGGNFSQNKQTVKDYMHKQNRPYNLLNIYDNLHGKIKKPQLQTILNQLTDEGEFSCKQFGKNKVYFINQNKFEINMTEVDELNSLYNKLRQENKEVKEQNKKLIDQYRKIMAKKTFEELQLDGYSLVSQIQKLKKKRDYLIGEDVQKVDEVVMVKAQKEGKMLEKELKKRRKLTKECLDTWAEALQKKVNEVAQLMGIELV